MDEMQVPSFIPQTPSNLNMEERRVGFGRRFGAAILDGLISMIIAVILYFTIGDMVKNIGTQAMQAQLESQGQSLENMPGGMGDMMSVFAAMSMLGTVAGVAIGLIELFTGASPGKMLLGVQIAHADGRKGSLAIWGQRWFYKHVANILSGLGFFLMISPLSTVGKFLGFVYLVGCLMVLGAKKQALHDMLAKTAVYHTADISND